MIITMIILTILAIILFNITDDDKHPAVKFLSGAGAIVLGIICLYVAVCIISYYFTGFTVGDKITMYQEENTQIQEQITTIVNNYQGYEKDIVADIADMEVLLIKLPELKSSELVKQQMALYMNNNTKIKELKEQQIDLKIGKWLLYFRK